ncbi:AmmeMemoRadiSam system protein B [Desulfoprunum benzoelyticum]|uniref:MEMO1 family protein HNQ81_003504 n=1 Tax=Desulfoprunum benzoelyticum TaxID=1506996 RepID=A0A840UVC9_9BACT|nr:AmmeMemoRadiSam system protein B [Desulfoprunum benzoelyticum]MBB5349742.1 hypothetical protein [Desulfoprunum benzoelyticum]MBM9531868.1 AmmeMemoRadiSam system protein B [Desulfoprunum benzoelyticum]
MHRYPAVAGRFYPEDPKTLARAVQDMLPARQKGGRKAIAVVSPHAGYMYSGAVAGEVIGLVKVPETVILLGPNHHGQGGPVALSTATWRMPMGDVPVDIDIADRLQAAPRSLFQADESAHRFEHCLEVQVPFLQAMQPRLRIVPVVLSHLPYPVCVEIASVIADVVVASGKDILIVASSDMTHYESRKSARKKDTMALDQIQSLDAEGLYRTVKDNRVTMCGIIPVTIALLAAVKLGARNAQIQIYTDSGAVSGDTDQVVGYAGVIIS